MDLSRLESLVRQGESDTQEFKRSTAQLGAAMKTVCGFLNAKGGIVLIGVRPDRDIIGQEVSDRTLEDIAGKLRLFEPPASVSIERVQVGTRGGEVIVLGVDRPEETRPFTYDGRPYRRMGNTTSVMPQQEYERLLLERAHSRRRWENATAEEYPDGALDLEEILRTLRVGKENRRISETVPDDAGEFLDRMMLRVDGKLINAAVVLFGKEFLPYYPQCELRMARFKGLDKTEFIDDRQLRGNVFRLLEEGLTFLSRHLSVAGRITDERPERVDEPQLPPKALREALVNALCHRDYSIYGGCVSIAIFDDRLEISSDGGLPFGQRAEDLKRDHKSMPRNPLIAVALYRRGLIERWGRGTQNIVKACVDAGLSEPTFRETGNSLCVSFPITAYSTGIRVDAELTDRQKQLLALLTEKEKMTVQKIKHQILPAVSDSTIKEDLNRLKKKGLVALKGKGPASYWTISNAAEK